MHKVKLVFLSAILLIIPSVVLAQNSENSPYTYYGYGNLTDKAFISQRGMGGIGYGLRNPQMINPMNPASFSSVDSMTFMFDLGVSGQMAWLNENGNKERKSNGNLEYLALQFPVAKKFGIGAGLEPVSRVGYTYANVDSALVHRTYSGSGGQSKVYAIFSYDLLDRFSIGAKLSYLFGDITHTTQQIFDVTNGYAFYKTDTIRSHGFLYDIGVQYHQPVGKFKTLTIGAVYSPKNRFGATVAQGLISSGTSDLVEHSVSKDSVFEMPETFGLGFTYNQLGKFLAGADILYQRWADAKYYDQTNAFNNRMKVNLGGEYIPNRTGSSLLARMRYRGGVNYTNSYLKVKGSDYKEYGVSLGLGIPLPDRRSAQRSFLNLAFEYSHIVPAMKTLIDEQYFKVSLSYTFNETWFFKQKVQ
jgi:hypothetical protein